MGVRVLSLLFMTGLAINFNWGFNIGIGHIAVGFQLVVTVV
jgi:hypothetical protein